MQQYAFTREDLQRVHRQGMRIPKRLHRLPARKHPAPAQAFFAARSKGRFAAVTAAAGAERHTIPQNRVTAFIQDDTPFITA